MHLPPCTKFRRLGTSSCLFAQEWALGPMPVCVRSSELMLVMRLRLLDQLRVPQRLHGYHSGVSMKSTAALKRKAQQ